jgi:hypothetical protein
VRAAEDRVQFLVFGGFNVDAQEHLLHVRQVLAGFLEEDLVELRQIDACALRACIAHGGAFRSVLAAISG